jgi:hypothetical protein
MPRRHPTQTPPPILAPEATAPVLTGRPRDLDVFLARLADERMAQLAPPAREPIPDVLAMLPTDVMRERLVRQLLGMLQEPRAIDAVRAMLLTGGLKERRETWRVLLAAALNAARPTDSSRPFGVQININCAVPRSKGSPAITVEAKRVEGPTA